MSEAKPIAPSLWLDLVGVPFSQRYVDVGGIGTRVIEAGEGTPLMMLHGTGGHAEAYLRNIAALSEDFRVIVYDMPGHGFSDGPDIPLTLDVYSDHLENLMDELGIERSHLSGESLGGWVAAWFASRNPTRVDRLILTTPGNVTSKPETMKVIRETTMKAVAEASPETVRSRIEWLFAPENRYMASEELVAVRLAIYMRPNAERTMRNVLVLQDPEVRARYGWDEEWTARIEAPTLIVWTSDDPTGTIDEGELLAGWIPGSRLVNIDGAGHWPQWERPEEFESLHREFLGAAARATTGK